MSGEGSPGDVAEEEPGREISDRGMAPWDLNVAPKPSLSERARGKSGRKQTQTGRKVSFGVERAAHKSRGGG